MDGTLGFGGFGGFDGVDFGFGAKGGFDFGHGGGLDVWLVIFVGGDEDLARAAGGFAN